LTEEELTIRIEVKEMLKANKKVTILLENDNKPFQKIILKGRYNDKQRRTKKDTRGRI
jgi:hypothetical protein